MLNHDSFRWPLLLCGLIFAQPAFAQVPGSTQPTVGIRRSSPSVIALAGARIIVRPGEVIENGVVIIDGSVIVAVGKFDQTPIPVGAETIQCDGQTIYAGLIDAWSEIDLPDPPDNRAAPHWNGNILAQRNASIAVGGSAAVNEKLRSQGITAKLVAPRGGIVQGTSCAVLANDAPGEDSIIADRVWQHIQLTVPRGQSRDQYPTSPMGATALARQTFYDARWYTEAQRTYAAVAGAARPQRNDALEALGRDQATMTFVADAANERMAIRTSDFAREFSLKLILKGSGNEYRERADIVARGHAILLPVDFPKAANVSVESTARALSQAELMHWKLAPENPARLADSGATFCLTTAGLENANVFLDQVRVAVKRGLTVDKALAAVTTTPADLMGIANQCGSVTAGKLANLVIADGDLFAEKTKIIDTWIAGKRFVIGKSADNNAASDLQAGAWTAAIGNVPVQIEITKTAKILVSVGSHGDGSASELKSQLHERHRGSGTIDFSKLDEQLPIGITRVSLLQTTPRDDYPSLQLTVTWPNGTAEQVAASRVDSDADVVDVVKPPATTKQIENKGLGVPAAALRLEPPATSKSTINVLYPFGAYGVANRATKSTTTLFRGATVWTCDEPGRVLVADLLVRDGKIAAIGEHLELPEGGEEIVVTGLHLTPGLIDCHSHIATDGGINEVGQAITSEVRISDFIDSSDITIYRQLAGGVTTANILHGSANPIGGQNCVIKLRWGESMDRVKMSDAPPGVKFALGENVKQSGRSSPTRYPASRMGVEQIIRDQLLAARLYDAEHRRYRSGDHQGLPPRIDLQLETLAEVLRGERWIHCHCYRQDEIVTFLNVLDEFNVQVGTLQHVLEGYKVAERLKQHGAMASSFADWWGYKIEAFDAIPHNGAMMDDQGIIVSFNSDDAELGTRLNTEAAKAIRYGGVDEVAALKFVTRNPALQLRIADFVGSIEVGKDADLVIWSGPPLSSTTRCEQTWIDGKCYFSRDSDAELRTRDAAIRAELIAEMLAEKEGSNKSETETTDAQEEADRWDRVDIYCRCRAADSQDAAVESNRK